MTTTDTDALTECIAAALTEHWRAKHTATGTPCSGCTAAVLPSVAEEVRKAKAEALREAADHIEDVVANARPEQAFTEHVLMEHGGPGYLRELAAEYETGDSDEHR